MSELERVKVTIERSRWLRGEGSTESALLREKDGKMCCLGFVAIALGRTPEQIKGQSSPTCGEQSVDGSTLAAAGTRLVMSEDGHWREPAAIERAMVVNDDRDVPDANREQLLTKLLAELAVDLEFVP